MSKVKTIGVANGRGDPLGLNAAIGVVIRLAIGTRSLGAIGTAFEDSP